MGMMRQLIVGTVRNNRNPVYLIDNLDDDKSAMLSRTDPVLLSAWSFLANQPSIMSLIPQKTYSVQNCNPATLQNRRPIEPTILSAVMMFGKCFTLIGFDLYLKDYADQI